MRAIGYFTINPETRNGRASAERLSQAFQEYCQVGRHIPHGTFADLKGEGGGTGWQEMMEFIRDSRLGYLVVTPDAGHLGETLEEQVERVLEMDALSSKVVCDDLDLPDPLQNALRGSREAARRSERIRAGMMAKAARGLGLGKPPYGYYITADGAFHVSPKESEVVRRIFRLYLEPGGSVRSVASALNARNVRTRKGRRWSLVTVRDVLRNAAYIGTYHRFGMRIPGSYEPIVSASEFRQAQDKMQARSPSQRNSHPAPVFLLSGVLYCRYCGKRMMGIVRRQTWQKKDGERARAQYRYYQCQSRINRNQCGYRTMRAGELEEEVVRIVRERLAAGERGEDPGDVSWLAGDKARSEAAMHSLDKQFMEGVQRAASGTMSLSTLRGGLEQLRAFKQELGEQAREAGDCAAARTRLETNVWKLLNEWDDLPDAERRDVLRSVVSKVTVKRGRPEITLR
ncbi:MAG: recombinase family protein [Chloroflexota bacterium]|nr:recombinase family protein [Chloroflexota bacterium]